MWVWWSLEFKGITATELPGRVPGRGCVCVRESARPAHLNPVPSNPPTQSQLTSCSLPGPNPHILQSSPPGHKVPFCPLSSPPISIASSLAMPISTSTVSFACPIAVIVLGREVAQQCAPLLDKPFEISRLGELITPIPQGASRHQSSFVSRPSVQPLLLSIKFTHSK